jgi:hypothetical protein
MPGYWEQRLALATMSQNDPDVNGSHQAWVNAGGFLREAAGLLASAAADMQEAFGANALIAEAGMTSFTAASDRATKRAEETDKAAQAIAAAKVAMQDAKTSRDTLPGVMADPGTFTPDPEATDADRLTAQSQHTAQVNLFHSQEEQREQRAREAVEKMNATFVESRDVMKEIHGQPDPEVPTAPSTSSTLGGKGGGGGGGGDDDDDDDGPTAVWPPAWWPRPPKQQPPESTWPEPPPPPPPGWVEPPPPEPVTTRTPTTHTYGTPQGPTGTSTVSTPTFGTSSTAAGVGGTGTIGSSVAGGIGAAGMGLLGGAGALGTSGGVSGAAVRGVGSPAGRAIGSTNRVGSGGVLGKGGAGGRAGAGGMQGRAGAGGAGRGGRGAGGRAGGRGAAGSRGAGAGSRRGGRKDDENGSERELFDDEKDWTDDEGMAPPVLD